MKFTKKTSILRVAYPFLQHNPKVYLLHIFNIFYSKWNLKFKKKKRAKRQGLAPNQYGAISSNPLHGNL